MMNLFEFFKPYEKVALVYYGDICSAYLLYATAACRIRAKAYLIESPSFSGEKLKYALSIAKALGAEAEILRPELTGIESGELEEKRAVLTQFKAAAQKDGYGTLIESSGADKAEDDEDIRLLRELDILMPFRTCGLDEKEVTRRAGNAGFRLN